MAEPEVQTLFVRDDDEGLFSRDIDGQLVRLDAPTEADYGKMVTLQIDGQSVTVPLAEPQKDPNGNVVLDIEDRTTPRYTTIYDAAVQLYVKHPGDEAKIPIPTLCHQPHMTPVAVCRLCVVQIYGQKRGQRAAERKLLPACQHEVKEGMEVFTMNATGPDGKPTADAERVRQAVKVVTELLASDHLKPAPPPALTRELAPYNELGQITERCGASASRFQLDELSRPAPAAAPQVGRRPLDDSSPVFLVDHSACILCDRCVRACDEVMENHVIGRTGKGINAGISFDLNDPMGKSSCVQCGECMVSCPTTAITFKPVGQVKIPVHQGSVEILQAAELTADPLFTGVPPKFLLWQQGLVARRALKAGDVLCRQGEAGNTAFLIKKGRLEVNVFAPAPAEKGLFGGLLKSTRGKPVLRFELTPENVIVGEMACLSGRPRAADVLALEDSEVWVVRRNVLDRIIRLPSQRERFETEYRQRALNHVLQNIELFQGIPHDEFQQIVDYLRDRLSFVRVRPGQTLFRQGDPVNDLYLVRLGYVRVSVRQFEDEARVLSLGPGTILGEIGLLEFSQEDISKTVDEADLELKEALERAGDDSANTLRAGKRTATCSALGAVELARLGGGDFRQLVRRFPVLRRRLVEQSLNRLRGNQKRDVILPEFVAQGLYEAQSVLVLDMDLCTRCDECTKGCVQQHGTESHGVPITRLLRDGMRFDKFVVATSCRSCVDPHCMVGCPVDSIHRGKHLQIVIEDHCIGCGLCASNCPYGSIFMMPNQSGAAAGHLAVAHPKAATCDLCDAEGTRDSPFPRCVAACPHEAAHRMTGDELLKLVSAKFAEKL
jgi:Fe-S-cluster-containing hydrogenase component 2/CRP-like cAMP-binding protein